MVLGEGPNWSRRVLSKKFKICDPPFYECHQIPNFDSVTDAEVAPVKEIIGEYYFIWTFK